MISCYSCYAILIHPFAHISFIFLFVVDYSLVVLVRRGNHLLLNGMKVREL